MKKKMNDMKARVRPSTMNSIVPTIDFYFFGMNSIK